VLHPHRQVGAQGQLQKLVLFLLDPGDAAARLSVAPQLDALDVVGVEAALQVGGHRFGGPVVLAQLAAGGQGDNLRGKVSLAAGRSGP